MSMLHMYKKKQNANWCSNVTRVFLESISNRIQKEFKWGNDMRQANILLKYLKCHHLAFLYDTGCLFCVTIPELDE